MNSCSPRPPRTSGSSPSSSRSRSQSPRSDERAALATTPALDSERPLILPTSSFSTQSAHWRRPEQDGGGPLTGLKETRVSSARIEAVEPLPLCEARAMYPRQMESADIIEIKTLPDVPERGECPKFIRSASGSLD